MLTVGTRNITTRELWIEKTLKSLPNESRILDAGAGQQTYKQFCTHLKYVSQDFAMYDGEGNGHGLQTKNWDYSQLDIISDITNIPEPEASFDAVLCSEVLEHLPEPISAIKEFKRLLKTGGVLIMTAPFCSLTHFAPYHYSSGYNRYFYEKFLTDNGFQIIELVSNGSFFEYLAQETKRIQSVAKRYAEDSPNIIDHLAIKFFLRMLTRFSKKDKGSEEILCFGYHVLAKKV
jgi:ubiquinone/menaquinone biosynthesis C-methylase UbiE